ncbi:hypothetical protein LINPERPRIM_LOCUS5149, partial [Linum perenne]
MWWINWGLIPTLGLTQLALKVACGLFGIQSRSPLTSSNSVVNLSMPRVA